MTHREYMKMKAKEAKDKAKEKAIQAKEAIEGFVAKHPKVFIIGSLAVGTGLLLLCTNESNSGSNDNSALPEPDNDYAGMIQKGLSESGDTDKIEFIPAKNESDESHKNALKKLWEEEYKDNWDKVNACASSLDLKMGEMFIIEDSKQYADEPWYDGLPIVSHLVNNSGVYPPDD